MTIREYNIVCLLVDKNIGDPCERESLKEDLKELADCYISENSQVQNYKLEQLIKTLKDTKYLEAK